MKISVELRSAIEALNEAGEEGIYYVGSANYASREREAIENLRRANERVWKIIDGKRARP
jgi:hypothetical protein